MTINPLSTGSSPIQPDGIAQSDQAQASKTDTPKSAGTSAAQTLAALDQGVEVISRKPADPLPPPKVNAENVQGAKAQLDGLPRFVNTDIHAMMALFQEIAQEMRSGARETRQAEANAQIQARLDAADKIRDAAQDRMIGAIVSGSMQIAGGVTQVAGGIKSASSLAKNSSVLSTDGTEARSVLSKIDSTSQKFQGTVSGMTGSGQIIQGVMDDQAASDEAIKAELEAQAQVHESARDDAKDLMNQMADVIRDVRDKLGSIEQSRLETNRGIARNI